MLAFSASSVKPLTHLLLLLCFISCVLVQPHSHRVHVGVKNRLGTGTTMTLHCQSKDNDLGTHNITSGGEFGWDFSSNVWGTTLFYCDLGWDTLRGYNFVAYDFQRDRARCATQCLWLVATEGMYGLDGQTGFWEFLYSWAGSV